MVLLSRVQTAGWVLLLLGCAGCAGRTTCERYVPTPETAQQALEAALTSWQEGQAPGTVSGFGTPLVVVDSLRKPGQRLERYEVLGEIPGGGPRSFAVRLLLDEPPEEQSARFVVLGVSPLWVFRQEDYDMMAHWECGMSTEKNGEK